MPKELALIHLCEKPTLEGRQRMKVLQLLERRVAPCHKRSPPLTSVQQFSMNKPIPSHAENKVDEIKICQKCGKRCWTPFLDVRFCNLSNESMNYPGAKCDVKRACSACSIEDIECMLVNCSKNTLNCRALILSQ